MSIKQIESELNNLKQAVPTSCSNVIGLCERYLTTSEKMPDIDNVLMAALNEATVPDAEGGYYVDKVNAVDMIKRVFDACTLAMMNRPTYTKEELLEMLPERSISHEEEMIRIGKPNAQKDRAYLNGYDIGWNDARKLVLSLADKLAKPEVNGETSDGYHTFNELYDHRVLLWINLCLQNANNCYVVEEHYDGWFLLGMETEKGQISYHCPNKYLYLVNHIERRQPIFDGHSSKDVLSRLVSRCSSVLIKKPQALSVDLSPAKEEQERFIAEEVLSGNIVKENYYRGCLTGIKIAEQSIHAAMKKRE